MVINKLFENLKTLKNGIYVFYRESGFGKSDLIASIKDKDIAIVDNSMTQINSIVSLKKMFNMYDNYKIIIIDGLFDHFEEKHIMHLNEAIPQNKVIIVSTKNELITKGFLKLNEFQENKIPTFFMTDNVNVSWQQLYISYYWNALNNSQNGSIHIDGKNYKINEADFTTLLIASRYWGKSFYIFKYEYNLDVNFYNHFSEVFYHDHNQNYKIDELMQHIKIPNYLDINKIKDYLGGTNLNFFIENINQLIKDIRVLKPLGFVKFLKCIKGRYYISKKDKTIPNKKLSEYRKIFSNGIHSVDFFILKLISINEVVIDNALEAFEK